MKDVKETSTFLIAVMPVMFIPAAVGLLDSWNTVRQSLVQYVIITFVSTFVVMGISGMTTQHIIRNRKREKQ